MEYSYHGTVDKLREFYISMRNLNVDIGTFEHTYNGVNSDVIFDTRNSSGWNLLFIKRIDGIVLKIQIQRGYRFTIEGNFAYKQFREYFGIGGAKGEFSIKDFVNHFSNQVPSEYLLSDKKRKIILRYDKLDNKSEGIYPIGIINWKIVHAKNPSLSNDRYHRTGKNLAKTKQLYPLIFEATKELDITIIYGKKSGEQTEDIKFGKYFFSKD